MQASHSAALAALKKVLGWVKQQLTDRNLFEYKSQLGPIGAAWQALDELPDGSRIAVFVSEPFPYTQFYPIFGRRLQHEPVPVDATGAPQRLLHESWNGEPNGWWSGWGERHRAVDAGALAGNLRRAKVDYVLTTRWSLGDWPPQQDALRSLPIVSAVFDDGYSTLWKIE